MSIEVTPNTSLPESAIQANLENSFEVFKTETIDSTTINHYNCELSSQHENDYKLVEFVPEHITNQLPIFTIPGFAATGGDYKNSFVSLAEQTGRRVIAWDQFRGVKTGQAIRYPRLGDERAEAEMYSVHLSKILALKETLERLNIRDSEVLAHSEGAINALLLLDAIYEQELRRNIRAPHLVTSTEGHDQDIGSENIEPGLLFSKMVLLNPAGLLERSVTDFIKSGPRELRMREEGAGGEYGTPKEHVPTGYKGVSWSDPKRLFDTVRYVAESTLALGDTSVVDLIDKYKDKVDITIVASDKDQHFDVDELMDFAEEHDITCIRLDNTDHAGALLDPERLREVADKTFSRSGNNQHRAA